MTDGHRLIAISRTFLSDKFLVSKIFTNAEKLPIIEGTHRHMRYVSVYTGKCENKQCVVISIKSICTIKLHDDFSYCFFNCMTTAWSQARKITNS